MICVVKHCNKAIPAARQKRFKFTVTCSSDCTMEHANELRRAGARRQRQRNRRKSE